MTQNSNHAGAALMRRPEPMGLTVSPAVDIYETSEAFVLAADVPGATREAMEVTIDGDALVIRAGLRPRHADEASVVSRELHHTGYERTFTLGEGIDRTSVDARLEDGVLTVKLLKSEKAKPRTIAIR